MKPYREKCKEGETNFYLCTKCNNVTDPYIAPKKRVKKVPYITVIKDIPESITGTQEEKRVKKESFEEVFDRLIDKTEAITTSIPTHEVVLKIEKRKMRFALATLYIRNILLVVLGMMIVLAIQRFQYHACMQGMQDLILKY